MSGSGPEKWDGVAGGSGKGGGFEASDTSRKVFNKEVPRRKALGRGMLSGWRAGKRDERGNRGGGGWEKGGKNVMTVVKGGRKG